MLADYHVHTDFSDDSVYPMRQVVRDAVSLRLDEICITDHVDYGVKPDRDSGTEPVFRGGKPLANVDYPGYERELQRVRDMYAGRIAVKMGMEFGVQVHTIPQFEALFRRYPFDFILLSIHQVEDKEFWNQDFQTGRTQKEYNERYYEEMLAAVRGYKNYSVLGHMDLLKRYDPAGVYPFENIKPFAAEILKTVIADGKGIELNTSSHRYGLTASMPSAELLRLYRDLGGTIVTTGSDSHIPAHLGAYLQEAQERLKALGFRYFCTYKRMEPIFHKL